MCGRFGSSFSGEELSERFETANKAENIRSFNIAPSYNIPVVTRNSPNKILLMKWGFVPQWAKGEEFKLKPINARAENIDTSPLFKSAFLGNRCIIPFSWFYEWQKIKLEKKQEKIPYLIKVKGQKIMGFAGIYSKRVDAEGLEHYTCAIITTKPNLLMEKIHNRMPVILKNENENIWLNHDTNAQELLKMLAPYPADQMEAYKISGKVNSPANDSEDIIKPI